MSYRNIDKEAYKKTYANKNKNKKSTKKSNLVKSDKTGTFKWERTGTRHGKKKKYLTNFSDIKDGNSISKIELSLYQDLINQGAIPTEDVIHELGFPERQPLMNQNVDSAQMSMNHMYYNQYHHHLL